MRLVLLLLAALVISGCANSESARLDKFETTARVYERAWRWSNFQTAFGVAGNVDAPAPDFKRLENLRVTSYDKLVEPQASNEGLRVTQMVEIRYVNIHHMRERSVTDEQLWEYSEKDKRWKLKSVFPTLP